MFQPIRVECWCNMLDCKKVHLEQAIAASEPPPAVRQEGWPTCHGTDCGVEIITAQPECRPFAVFVRDPYGRVHHAGDFCLDCMTKLALAGVLIFPRPKGM
jgi:hypothetical protein